jgi:D-glycero-alpha-D-manno-heptose 1-phosphate guanylyltransferase
MATSNPAKEAIILAGGLGTRLRAVVPDLPKPLAPVAGRPFLAWVLDALAAHGFSSITLSVGYRHELIQAAIGETWQGMRVRYAIEAEPLGTGGAMRHALTQTQAAQIYVLNGDTFLDLDYDAMMHAHLDSRAQISIAAVPVEDIGRYGGLELRDATVTGFLEKGGSGAGMINGGTYLINRTLFDAFDLPLRFSFEADILQAHVASLSPRAFTTSGLFIDMGIPEDYARAQSLFGRA